MAMTSPGRNDRCACGSGRKYKHCCLRALEAEDAARLRLRQAEGLLVPALVAYAAEQFGEEYFTEAWAEFFVWDSVPDDVGACREFGTTYDPFLVFSFVPDAAERELPDGWPTEPLALHFLHREVESCPEFHREFIRQACRSYPSFFVAESVQAGRSIDIKDILTGRRFHVLEQSASRSLRQGDLTFTRVVTAGGASIMIGASPWIIPADWHLSVLDFREEFSPRRLLTLDDLREYDLEILECYHGIVRELQHPTPPTLCNTDGDPLEPTTLTYALRVTAGEAIERLRPLATLRGDVHIDGEVHDEAGVITAATLTWMRAGNKQRRDWDNTALGTLRLHGQQLVVEVNSARRRDRIAKEIAKRLGAGATLVETTVTDIAEALEAARAGSGQATGPSEPEMARSPEYEALESELAQQHWDAWVDMRVPALGNRTPRQAARTAGGRERLEALLTSFARKAERSPSGLTADVAALRQRLGLGPLTSGQ